MEVNIAHTRYIRKFYKLGMNNRITFIWLFKVTNIFDIFNIIHSNSYRSKRNWVPKIKKTKLVL